MARNNAATEVLAVAEVLIENETMLKGKTFSITGHLGRKREDVVELIRQAGGDFSERPKWNGYRGERYLITNKDWNRNSTVMPKKSSKLVEAESHGWKIISEDEFLRMIGVST